MQEKNNKTVFVLGAGASVPYGYPTGDGLRKEICYSFYNDFMSDNCTWSTRSMRLSYQNLYREFTGRFEGAKGKSIDLFLSQNPNYHQIGKQAIIQRMLEAEMKSIFNEGNGDWYTYLYKAMGSRKPTPESYLEFGIDKYSFITLNYDRSLEFFLSNAFYNSYSGMDVPEFYRIFADLKIWHVYGQIAYLPWQRSMKVLKMPAEEGFDYRLPDYNYDHAFLNYLSKNISVIHEHNRCSEEKIKQIKSEIADADTLIFLGFGFAEENLEVLELPRIFDISSKTIKIFSTCYGMKKKQSERIRKLFSSWPSKIKDSDICIADPSWDCLRALQEWDIL